MGTPLNAVMSTATMVALAAAFAATAAGAAPAHLSPDAVGFSPDTDRYSSSASTRLSTRPAWTAWRPHAPRRMPPARSACGASLGLGSASPRPEAGEVGRKGARARAQE